MFWTTITEATDLTTAKLKTHYDYKFSPNPSWTKRKRGGPSSHLIPLRRPGLRRPPSGEWNRDPESNEDVSRGLTLGTLENPTLSPAETGSGITSVQVQDCKWQNPRGTNRLYRSSGLRGHFEPLTRERQESQCRLGRTFLRLP